MSIVIPSHNHGCYLKDAIDSALSQTYRPIEVIVVDDGSADNSAEIAGRYPVKLIAQNNQGVSAAMDRGIELAGGKYLLRLDADDKLHPSFLERCVPVLEEHLEVAFVYTWAVLFGARSGVFYSRPYDLLRLRLGNFIPVSAVARTKAIRAVGGFDKSLPWMEDWDLWLSLAEKGLFGRLVPEPLLYYRQHEDGGRNAPSSAIAHMTVRQIMLKHPTLFPPWYLAMERVERMAENVLPSFLKTVLRRISPRTYSTWASA